jgi:hypothetical protein
MPRKFGAEFRMRSTGALTPIGPPTRSLMRSSSWQAMPGLGYGRRDACTASAASKDASWSGTHVRVAHTACGHRGVTRPQRGAALRNLAFLAHCFVPLTLAITGLVPTRDELHSFCEQGLLG